MKEIRIDRLRREPTLIEDEDEDDELNDPWDDGYQNPPDDGGWDEHYEDFPDER